MWHFSCQYLGTLSDCFWHSYSGRNTQIVWLLLLNQPFITLVYQSFYYLFFFLCDKKNFFFFQSICITLNLFCAVLVMTFLPMGAHYLVDICRQKNKSESKNETQIEDLSESVLANTIYPNLGADLKRDHD